MAKYDTRSQVIDFQGFIMFNTIIKYTELKK